MSKRFATTMLTVMSLAMSLLSAPVLACSVLLLSPAAAKDAANVYIGYVTSAQSLEPKKWPRGAYRITTTITETLKGAPRRILVSDKSESCDGSMLHVDQKVVALQWKDSTSVLPATMY